MRSFFYSTSCLLLVLLMSTADVRAADRNPEQIREMVRAAMGMRHPEDSPEWWRSLGVRAPKVIIEMYQSSSSTVEKMKLIRGLSHFREDPEAIEFVKKEAEQTDQEVIRYEVLQGIAQSSAEKEFEFAARFLQSHDPHERKFAGMVLVKASLSEKSKSRAQEILKKYQAQEKEAWVIKSIEQFRLSLDQKEMIQRTPKFKDAVDSAWSGGWVGYFVTNQWSKETQKLKPLETVLNFSWPTSERLDAEISWIEESGKKNQLSVSGFKGGGLKLFHSKGNAVWEWVIRREANGKVILRGDGPQGVFVLSPRLDTPGR